MAGKRRGQPQQGGTAQGPGRSLPSSQGVRGGAAGNSGVFDVQSRPAVLHRCRCWHWAPSAVVAASACPTAPLVAVGLESGDVELWDLSFMMCIQRVVGSGVEITALAWAKDGLDGGWRTFAAFLDGSLAEISWPQARVVASTDSSAGTVWALAAQPIGAVRPGFSHQLVAACDDGSARLFSVEGGEQGLQFERILSRQQGRLLTAAWDPSGGAVVVGGADGCVHALDAVTGVESLRLTVGASTHTPVCVWRVAVLPDGTLVTGDSSGAVQFWDGRFGGLLHRFTVHSADVLALAAAPGGGAVWAAGVDPSVAMFSRVAAAAPGGGAGSGSTAHGGARALAAPQSAGASGPQWAYLHHKRPHSHDVRVLEVVALGGGRHVLLSGGADAQLMVYPTTSFLAAHPARLTKCPQRPLCRLATPPAQPSPTAVQPLPAQGKAPGAPAAVAASLATSQGPARLLTCERDTLDVWQLGTAVLPPHLPGAGLPLIPLDLLAAPRHLARISCKVGHVRGADISRNGQLVACSAGQDGVLRVYTLADPGTQRGVTRLPVQGAEDGGYGAVQFTQQHLLAAHRTGCLHVFALPPAAGAASSQVLTPVATLRPFASDAEQLVQPGIIAPRAAFTSAAGKKRNGGRDWAQFLPPVTVMCAVAGAGPGGDRVAVAGPNGVAVLDAAAPLPLSTPSSSAAPWTRAGHVISLPHGVPVTALAFSPDGGLLALLGASGRLSVWDLSSGQPLPWAQDNDKAIAKALDRLPGAPQGVAFAPRGSHPQLLVHSAGGFCLLDTVAPVGVAGDDRGLKRRRTAAKPAHGPSRVLGGGPVVEAHVSGVVDGRVGGIPLPTTAENGRTVLLEDPVAFMGFAAPPFDLVLLEKPWAEVVAALPPPLHRPRYGA